MTTEELLLVGLAFALIVVALEIRKRMRVRTADDTETGGSDDIAAAERRVLCGREGHIGYRKDIHGLTCPVCGSLVWPLVSQDELYGPSS